MNKYEERSRTLEAAPRARGGWRRLVWGFPVVAAIFLGGLIYQDHLEKSRVITVYFKNVEGVQGGNTTVQCRGAQVGIVKDVKLSKDHQWVAVGITLQRGQENLESAGALFWVVKAELGAGVVTGLQTVMSGSYIQVRPGDGQWTNKFIGSEDAPAVMLPEKMLPIVLLAPALSSLQQGSPIYYRGIQAGKVTGFQLGGDAQEVVIRASIREAYAPLVRKNSVFWNAGGIDVNFSLLHGASISAESAKALVAGAIEFATPDNYQDPAPGGTVFRLFEKPLEEWKTWRPRILLKLPPQAAQGRPISSDKLPPTTLQK